MNNARNNAPARNSAPARGAAPARNAAPARPAPRPAAKPAPAPEPEYASDPAFPVIEVTEAKAWPLQNPSGKTLGFGSVTLAGQIVVDDLRIVDGSKGLFVAVPERAYTDKDGNQQYKKIVKPISREQFDAIQDAVLAAWGEAVSGGERQ